MVDGVNFNPFTMKAWTAEEITELDTNGDGKVSESEVKAKWSWLAGKDTEGDVAIGENTSDLTQAAKKAGMTDTANTPEELKSNISILADEYIEQYMTEHMELSDLERSGMQSLISTSATNFAAEYIAANPQGPYDMTKVTEDFVAKMEQVIADNKAALDSVNATMDGYKNNVDANYETMLNYTNSAMENKNISNTEWNQIKNKAVQYLMGMLLNGQVDTEFMQSISQNYNKNTYYAETLSVINEIKGETDPVKIQQLLTEAQNNISKFLDNVGKTNVVNGIQNYSKAKDEAAITSKVSGLVDNWIENNITSSMTEQEKSVIKQFAESCISKFVTKLTEENRLSGINDNQINSEFTAFLEKMYSEFKSIQETITKSVSDIDSTYNTLVSVSDNAKYNGNVSDEEKAAIVNVASELIMKQLLSGMEDIPFMQGLNADYKTTTDFKTLQDLITKIKSSVDPDEIKEIQIQAKDLLMKILNAYSGEQLTAATDSVKPIVITDDVHNNAIVHSSIGAAYSADVTRTAGDYVDYNEDSNDIGQQPADVQEAYNQLQEQARQDMLAYAEQLKAELKVTLGSSYNEDDINKYINDAINDTIAQFSNVDHYKRRWGKDANYKVQDNAVGFFFLERSRSHGRWGYDLTALIDTFKNNFNVEAKEGAANKIDSSNITYDKENVVISLGNEYYSNTKVQDENRLNIYEQAKSRLMTLSAAIKSSLIAEGVSISTSNIDKILDDSMVEVLDNIEFNSEYSFTNSGFIISYSFNTKVLADEFMSKVDEKLKAENK